MLKALELIGFKSFAEKARFEFPRGITVIVGPNGSGKSNVVDAIKWVLGEQSVKSLRGKEMADVIFNGSGSRRGLNSAEITLTFDNSSHLFPVDTPEVHITRRVYRSGEGEYLINRNPARLRDIRDLLTGTGLGTHAYSVIEQGKVDVLLQSSPRERRLIFEEAAGISRFKARKIESLRRLERVEQNLLRLSDIVDEVDSRLRSVRLQAGKARRYKQYTDRLQELRTQVAMVDWQRLSEQLAQFDAELQSLVDQRDAAGAQAEALGAQSLQMDNEVGEINEAVHQAEAGIAENRERIASVESTIDHQRAQAADLEQEIARQRRRLVALSGRAGDLQHELEATDQQVHTAEEHHREITLRLGEGERELTGLIGDLDHLRGEHEQHRSAHMEQVRAAAALGNRISALESQAAAAEVDRDRCRKRIEELDRQVNEVHTELERLRQTREQLAETLQRQQQILEAAKSDLAQLRQARAARQEELANLRQRHSASSERVAVLEELQRRQEGLGAGVKEVLALAKDAPEGPFGEVRGLVADLLRVSVEIAPLIEVALGQAAQHIVVGTGGRLLDHLVNGSRQFAGRVGFVWLDKHPAEDATKVDLEGRPGVLGRADRFVEAEPALRPLATRLLGRVWIVERLSHALELAALDHGARFVTLSGELVADDGTLIAGPRHDATGLISRHSQLRALKTQLDELTATITQAEQAVARLDQQVADQRQEVEIRETQYHLAADQLAEHRHMITAAESRRAQFDKQQAALDTELNAAVRQHQEACDQLADLCRQRDALDRRVADMEAELTRMVAQLERLESQRQTRDRQATQVKVELAKSEERLRNLQTRMRQFEETRQERHRAIADSREQLAASLKRLEQSRWKVLRGESEIAELYLRKEGFARKTVAMIDRREHLRQKGSELAAEVLAVRGRIRKAEEKIHTQQLAANEIHHQRNTLADRLREDYGIELAELEHEPTAEQQHQRDEVQEEIDDLRRKIANLGNVNLEALEELEELDDRYAKLSGQYQDLAQAKNSLEKIIDKINTDSRRLFTETLETVRGHFQTLFRDLFGGGQADIILEDDVDILESGIEIVARPPGKEPRSISLLSGGEKTLTCVALLLAIFRSRPSPFCVLDEVDAALDEANIDRFTKVLQDFLDRSQFIIVTHSKKTMTCADTIYGVTMQESGVSKQVAVRFEDVSEDGHILSDRLTAADDEPESGDETQAA